MSANPVETPKKTVQFDSLSQLRDELGKQTKNPERLSEFQKTIDAAIREGEKRGIIEFSEDEWKSLITDEDLPPIEQVKELLKNKIEGMKGVKTESKEKREGILGELQTKAEKAKKSLGEKADGFKNATTGKLQEWKDKAEKLKGFSKPALWMLGIGLSLKLWGYKLGNWLSGLFGKKGEYDDEIKKIEMEKEFMKDPKAALEKYGAEAKEKLESGKGGAVEKGKEAVSKVPAIAALSAAAVGIYAVARKFLPKSITENVDGKDGTSILKLFKGRKCLKLFGIGGLALLGAGGLFAYFSENPDKLKSLGEIPEDAEGKKSWWKRAAETAGIEIKEGAEGLWKVLSGEKVEEYFEEKGPREGYQFLEDSNLLKDAKNKIKSLAYKLELIYKIDPTKFNVALMAIGIIKPSLITSALGAGVKGVELTKAIFKALYGSGKNHPLLWSLEIAMLGSQVEAVKHIQVPENMTTDSISDMLNGMTDVGEIREKLESAAPGLMQSDSVKKVSDYLENNCAKLTAQVEYLSAHWQEKLDDGLRNLLVSEDREQISRQDKIGLEAFQKELQYEKTTEERKGENLETLCGKDMQSGVLADIIGKSHRQEPLTEGDIHKLIAATEGTHIRIFPEGGSKEGKTLQWVWVGDDGNPEGGFAKNICINPLLEEDTKVEVSRDFFYDQHNLGFAGKLARETYNTGWLDLVSEVTKALTAEPGKVKGITERMIDLGATIGCFGKKTVIQYMNEVYVLGPASLFETLIPGGKELTGQEFLVEYAGGLVPVFLVSYTNRRLLGRGGGALGRGKGILNYKILAETLAYPIKLPADAGMYIYKKMRQGDIAGIFTSPFVRIQEKFCEAVRLKGGMPESVKIFGNLVHEKEGLLKIHEKIQSANYWKKLPFGEKRAQKLIDEVSSMIEKRGLNTSQYLGKWKGKIKDLRNTDDILKDVKKSIETAENAIKLNSSKALAELKTKLEHDPASLSPRNDIPKTKAELEKMNKLCNQKTQELEAEKQKALERHASGKMPDAEWEKFKMDSTRRTVSLKGYVRSIDAHIEIHERTGEAGKWRHVGRGILGIAALVGIMAGVQKLRADEPGMEVPELDKQNGAVNFYGFRAEEEIVKTETKETGDKKKESIKDSPEYIQPFLTSLANIKGMYGTEFEFLSDPKALKESTDETIKNKVNNLCNIHGQMIADIKKLLKENKEPLKKYFASLKEKNLYVKESSINAFFGISEKNGELKLDYMDADDFSDTIWEMADFNRDNADEILAGKYDGWDQAWYVTKRAAPVSGTYMDGKDMVKNFQRGKTGDAFKSMGWMTVGLACDIGMLFSFGSTAAPKAAINGTRAVLSWARMGKVIEAMRTVKNIMTAGKVGTGFAKTMSFALTHAGMANMIGMGAHVGRQVIVFPRSQSVKIDEL